MIHRSSFRVYYEDTDMAGVVYYANFLKFIERGRSDAVREGGLDQEELRQSGAVFVIRRVEADYLRPGRYGDLLTVSTQLEAMGGASFTLNQQVHRGEDLLFEAKVVAVHMSLEGRPRAIKGDMRRRLAACFGMKDRFPA